MFLIKALHSALAHTHTHTHLIKSLSHTHSTHSQGSHTLNSLTGVDTHTHLIKSLSHTHSTHSQGSHTLNSLTGVGGDVTGSGDNRDVDICMHDMVDERDFCGDGKGG